MDWFISNLEQKQFKCAIDKSKSLEYNLKTMAECKCCPRHMTCRPEFDMMKILIDNQDEKEVKKIRDHIKENGIVRVGVESIKFVFSDSFYQIVSFICDISEISTKQYSELQHMTQTVVSYYEQLLTTFYFPDTVILLCKMFEYKIMNVIIDEEFVKESTKKIKGERLEGIIRWAIEIYDDLKSIRYMETHHINETKKDDKSDDKSVDESLAVCTCRCRKYLRVYGESM